MILTEMQLMVLGFINGTPECNEQDVLSTRLSDDIVKETLRSLTLNGFIERQYRFPYLLTLREEGQARVERARTRITVKHCPACVKLNCVCEIRTICLADGDHDLGCHGSHE